jgi:hypothetical protein
VVDAINVCAGVVPAVDLLRSRSSSACDMTTMQDGPLEGPNVPAPGLYTCTHGCLLPRTESSRALILPVCNIAGNGVVLCKAGVGNGTTGVLVREATRL